MTNDDSFKRLTPVFVNRFKLWVLTCVSHLTYGILMGWLYISAYKHSFDPQHPNASIGLAMIVGGILFLLMVTFWRTLIEKLHTTSEHYAIQQFGGVIQQQQARRDQMLDAHRTDYERRTQAYEGTASNGPDEPPTTDK